MYNAAKLAKRYFIYKQSEQNILFVNLFFIRIFASKNKNILFLKTIFRQYLCLFFSLAA